MNAGNLPSAEASSDLGEAAATALLMSSYMNRDQYPECEAYETLSPRGSSV